MKRGRPVVLGLSLLLVLAAGGWQYTQQDATTVEQTRREPQTALIDVTGNRGAVWFCPLVASTTDNAQASIRVSRFSVPDQDNQQPAKVLVTLYGPAGEIARSSAQVDKGSLQVGVASLLRASDTGILPSIAATVESDDVAIVVESSLGSKSNGFVPCSTSVSSSWYIPVGSTRLQHTTELALFNPFPGTAIVDLEFWSERGGARPTALQGLAVPGHGLRIIELGDFVRRRERLATAVSVRSGRVLAASNHRFDGTSELAVGIPGPSTTWFHAAAGWTEQRSELYTLLNPGDDDVTLELSATLSAEDVEPFELTVPAGSSVVFDPAAEGRIPSGTPYSVVAQVTDGPDVVIARSVDPTARSAPHFSVLASAAPAQTWVVPVADAASITLFNPYDEKTSVSIRSGLSEAVRSDASTDKTYTLGAGAFRTVQVTADQRRLGVLIVSADAVPVVVSARVAEGVDVSAVPVGDR